MLSPERRGARGARHSPSERLKEEEGPSGSCRVPEARGTIRNMNIFVYDDVKFVTK
jgi:hypothetical protein